MSDKPGLRPQQAVGQALRDIARHILAEGRTAVEDRKRVEAVAVHDFRAAMKSWRAFLRLVEPHLGPEERGWRTEARDLARMLAGARDAQAALDAVADAEHTRAVAPAVVAVLGHDPRTSWRTCAPRRRPRA